MNIFTGLKDTTTKKSDQEARDRLAREKIANGGVAIDSKGRKLCVDPKTNAVKISTTAGRSGGDVFAATANPIHSGGGGGGNFKRKSQKEILMEYSKPPRGLQEEFNRLIEMGVPFDPNKSYQIDPPGMANHRAAYVYGGGSGMSVKNDIEYDREIHMGLHVGYKMFKGGLGYIHSNGAVSRVVESLECGCGACHQ